jgi:hypothetical protein
MDKDYIQQLIILAQARIRLYDAINMLQDLDKWTIIIGDNHLDIEKAIKHLETLEISIATRVHILTDSATDDNSVS